MKKLLLIAVFSIVGLSSCGTNVEQRESVTQEKMEHTKRIHPMYIGEKWYYFYY